MNLYAQDLSLFDYGDFGDLMIHHHDRTSSRYHEDDDYNSISVGKSTRNESKAVKADRRSPPRHRHDGTSPLPLGMDWSTPPRKWDAKDSVWPHDPHTGWSYCVTVPSWILLPKPRGSDPVAFYRVQVGIQSPEGVTSTRGILRRYSDFLKLLSELRKTFPRKELPQAPPKRILRLKSRVLLEERRCALEDWMEKLLSDIDISRSASVATFLELEAAARSSFNDQQNLDAHSSISGEVSSLLLPTNSDASVLAGNLSVASDCGNDSPDDRSELGTPRIGRNNFGDLGLEYSTSEQNINAPAERIVKYGMFNRNFILENLGKFSRQKMLAAKESSIAAQDKLTENTAKLKSLPWDGAELLHEPEYLKLDGHVRRLSSESVGSDLSSVRASEISNFGLSNFFGDGSFDHAEFSEASGTKDSFVGLDSLFVRNSLIALPSDQRLKLNRVLNTMQQRLATAKTDMEDLLARLNQEVAVRQFLMTKLKDLEVELETTRDNCKENMQQTALIEKEKFTQMQWDLDELQKKCMVTEQKLEYEQAERARVESSKISIIQENEMLLQQLDATREQLENLHKHHEEFEVKSKADVKVLVKEVKSLRSSQLELKQELSRLLKEKLEVEAKLLLVS